MKRNREATKELLQTVVGASIDFDEVVRKLKKCRAALVEIEGGKDDINELLGFIDTAMNDFRKKRLAIAEIRKKGEMIIWKRQVVSPHLKRQIGELELSQAAARLIPAQVKTIGQLCQYRSSELAAPGNRYLHELMDGLRILYALVLKPDE